MSDMHYENVNPPLPTTHHLTRHAKVRMSQRGVSELEIALTRQHGQKNYGRECIIYKLGCRQIKTLIRELGKADGCPLSGPERSKLEALNGTVVIISLDGRVITAFRNPSFKIKRDYKPKGGRWGKKPRANRPWA